MEQRLFIYSRTKYFDYRLLATPKEEFVTNNIRWEFIEFIRQVINTDNPLNGEIDTIRWSFYKIDNYILWGIGCNNSDLSSIYCYDKAGTPVRGFFGFITKLNESENISLVYDLEYFREIYSVVIVPIWELKDEETVNSINSFFFPMNINSLEYIYPNKQKILNTGTNNCLVYPITEDLKLLIGSAFSYAMINFVSGLNRSGHAVESHFMNSTSIDCDKRQIFTIQNISENSDEDSKPFKHKINYDRSKNKSGTIISTSLIDKAIHLINHFSNKFNVCTNDLLDEIKSRLEYNEKRSKKVNYGTENNIDVPNHRKASREKIDKLKKDYNISKELININTRLPKTRFYLETNQNVDDLEEILLPSKQNGGKINLEDVVDDFQTEQQFQIKDSKKDRINFIKEQYHSTKNNLNSNESGTSVNKIDSNQNKDDSEKSTDELEIFKLKDKENSDE
jgi:hypothetical protein